MKKLRGVSMIEMVMVIVLVGVIAVGMMPFYVQSTRAIILNEDLQTGAQLLRACGEHILVTRRWGAGYAAVDGAICDALPTVSSYTLSVVVTAVDNATEAFCPVGTSCKHLVIAVQKAGTNIVDTQLLLVM